MTKEENEDENQWERKSTLGFCENAAKLMRNKAMR